MTTKDLQQEFISKIQQRIFDKWSQQGDFDQDWKPEDINWWKWLRFPKDMKDQPKDSKAGVLNSPGRWLGEYLRGSKITDRHNPEFTKFIERMRSSATSDDELAELIVGNIKDFPSTSGIKIRDYISLLGGEFNKEASGLDIPDSFSESWYDLFEPLTSVEVLRQQSVMLDGDRFRLNIFHAIIVVALNCLLIFLQVKARI